jgi:phenylacetate-CoA ligase
MALYNTIQEKVVLPVYDRFSGKSIARSLSFLLESQGWSHDRLMKFQEERLLLLVKHAYDNVPFYNSLFKEASLHPSDIKGLDDLHKIPVISKDDMRNRQPGDYLAANRKPGKDIRMNSSGSTGEPFTYLINPDAFSMNYAAAIRGWYWMGYRLGDKYVKMSQNQRSSGLKKLQDLVLRNGYLFIRDLTPQALEEVIINLNRFRPRFIRCYPDPLVFIARLINEGMSLDYAPEAINTTGNILTPESRAAIETAFRAPVFDSYSCESSAQFFQGTDRRPYYASMEYAITEVLNSEGRPAERGRHVTTDLWNFSMPFLRYDTQDIIEREGSRAGVVTALDPFRQITGRNSDILVTPSGKYLIVHTFTIFFEYFGEIRKFQVIQESADRMIVRLVVNDRFTAATGKKIQDGLAGLIGSDVSTRLEIVEDIPPLPSGKRRFLIRDESVRLTL